MGKIWRGRSAAERERGAAADAVAPERAGRCCVVLVAVAGLISMASAPLDQRAVPRTPGQDAVTVRGRPRPGITILPGQDIQANVIAAAPGTTFLIKAGVHRLQTIRPKDNDQFIGEPGAVLSGARVLTSFTRSGEVWFAAGQTEQGVAHGECLPPYPRCRLPEQLFIDDEVLLHVDSLAQVRAGTWHFDYAADRVYVATDPAGRRIELSVTAEAIQPTGNNVTVTGLTVEKYATLAQRGSIDADGTSGWIISNNEVRWNHGVGIHSGDGAQIVANHVHHNGQLGIGGAGVDVLVEGNEIDHNNTAHFDPGWEAGGTKFVETDRLIVRGNLVHHNEGPGLWTDENNINTLYETNTVTDNTRSGIFHEISYAATIRNNIVRRNGFGFPDWIWGAGILVAGSPNVEIYGNTVDSNADGIAAVQQRRGSGTHGAHEIANLWVHDNAVTMAGGWTGMVQDVGDLSYFTSRSNRFDRNRYQLSADAAFAWSDGQRSESQWRAFGQDVNGTFTR